MSLQWCTLPVFLAIVAGMVVMEQTTRATLELTDSVETSVGVTQNPSKYSESTTESLATTPPLNPSSATPPPLDPSSITPPPLDPSSATPPLLDQSSATPQHLDPMSTPLADATGSPTQLTSTAGTPTTSAPVYSTTGVLSHTTQDFNASESSIFLRLETETGVNQDSSPTIGSQHWTTDETGTGTYTPEITSASTAVTNTSEVGGYVHPDVWVKTQPPPTSTLTSTKKQPTSFHPVTTSAPTVTTITKVNESMPLNPTIPFISKIIKTTTRSYNRLSTAQVTAKKISLVAQCLIAIAILAGVCTIFVICTVVLCTKLSTQRQNYRVNRTNGTELICISALLPEDERKLRRKMRPKRLRDHLKETAVGQNSDSDDDDDLTLHSFVTEH
ncbi:P-selectin glycoprotein ligand 1 [Cetorhinus maximus]